MLYKEVFGDESIEMRYKTQQCSFEVTSNEVKVSSFPCFHCLLCGVTQCAQSGAYHQYESTNTTATRAVQLISHWPSQILVDIWLKWPNVFQENVS